jgi:hypothetical protein
MLADGGAECDSRVILIHNESKRLEMMTWNYITPDLVRKPRVWKLLGVVALLIPKFPLLKEWAYAGFFFAMSGAVFSHIASGDSVNKIFPALLPLILTVVSWFFRPADRKIISVKQ